MNTDVQSSAFTVLLPVYRGDRADYVAAAYQSVTTDQQRRPDQVLIVRDGPVSPELDDFLDRCESDPGTRVLRLAENRGLTHALNAGLAQITTEYVARADADDICLPERFSTQLPFLVAGADIVGSAIAEFEHDPGEPGQIRPVDTDPQSLAERARWETPFHHPTVMFRRSVVAAVGGYPDQPLLEDYLLWAKLILAGATLANCEQVLVCYRVGAGAYHRRGGIALFQSELALQKRFRQLGFTTTAQWFRNVVVRGGYRLVPTGLRRRVYRFRMRQRPGTSEEVSP